MRFSQVAGQQAIRQQLQKSVANNKVSHAYIFLEHEGQGALPMALAFAQYLNCTGKNSMFGLENDSCGGCPSCQQSAKLTHPDIHFSFPTISGSTKTPPKSSDFISQWREAVLENPYLSYSDWMQKLEAENKQGNITMAECHEIIRHLGFKAFSGGYKVQIVWLAEYLDKSGNALLKIMEEPAEGTVFILIAQNREAVLGTILSRAQAVVFPPLTQKEIYQELINRYELSPTEAEELSIFCNGNLSEAIRLHKSGFEGHAESFIAWMRTCYKPNADDFFKTINEIGGKGREALKDYLRYALRIIRELFLLNSNLKEINALAPSEKNFAEKLSPFIHHGNVHDIYKHLNDAHYHIERNANPKIVMFNLSLHLHQLLKK